VSRHKEWLRVGCALCVWNGLVLACAACADWPQHLLPDGEDDLTFLRFLLPFSPLAAAAGLSAGTRCRKLLAASGSGSSSEGSRYRWFFCTAQRILS
jgi:hypothetical protein